jgi:hypothetical protein
MASTCTATRRDGRPCQTQVVGGSRFCFAHDPDLAAKRAEAHSRGGRNRATSRRLDRLVPASLKPALALMFATLEETHRGELDPRTASAMAAVAGAIVRLYQVGTLEERLAALEERAG